MLCLCRAFFIISSMNRGANEAHLAVYKNEAGFAYEVCLRHTKKHGHASLHGIRRILLHSDVVAASYLRSKCFIYSSLPRCHNGFRGFLFANFATLVQLLCLLNTQKIFTNGQVYVIMKMIRKLINKLEFIEGEFCYEKNDWLYSYSNFSFFSCKL